MSMDLSDASEYSKKMKDGFQKLFEALFEAETATIPILNFPVVGTIFRFFASKIIAKCFESGRLAIFFKFIDMRSVDQKGEYVDSVDKLTEAIKSGDKDAVKKALKNMFDKIDDFVRFNRI